MNGHIYQVWPGLIPADLGDKQGAYDRHQLGGGWHNYLNGRHGGGDGGSRGRGHRGRGLTGACGTNGGSQRAGAGGTGGPRRQRQLGRLIE